jgi:hypothetical protein
MKEDKRKHTCIYYDLDPYWGYILCIVCHEENEEEEDSK